jgi:hypothetical protein
MPAKVDLTGMKFGRLQVLSEVGKTKGGQYKWACECDCGNKTAVAGFDLRSGHTMSCGCMIAESLSKRRTKHGQTGSPEWRSWNHMHRRCRETTAINYARYGGLGTRVCAAWADFSVFLRDMGPKPTPKHSIDRIDPFGNYEPSNCRWATASEQNRNKRATAVRRAA